MWQTYQKFIHLFWGKMQTSPIKKNPVDIIGLDSISFSKVASISTHGAWLSYFPLMWQPQMFPEMFFRKSMVRKLCSVVRNPCIHTQTLVNQKWLKEVQFLCDSYLCTYISRAKSFTVWFKGCCAFRSKYWRERLLHLNSFTNLTSFLWPWVRTVDVLSRRSNCLPLFMHRIHA